MKTANIYKCYQTGEIIKENIKTYYVKKAKESGKSKNEIRQLVLLASFDVESIVDLYVNKKYGLPKISKTYSISYEVIIYILKLKGVPLRSKKEATKYGASLAKETNLERYGVDHTFKVAEFQKKRVETYLKKYNYDNPFKCKNFLKKVEKTYKEKYGRSLKEHRSHKSKQAWAEKTEEEKYEWLKKSIHSKKSIPDSKLELKVATILLENEISFQTQYRVGRFYYDFFLADLNLILEINGDFWHANPKIYRSEDLILKRNKYAKEIWQRDLEKKEVA